MQKTLEDANLKLSSVLTDIMGLFGRAIIQARVEGERDPDRLLALVHRRARNAAGKHPCRASGAHRPAISFPVAVAPLHLRQIDALNTAINEIDAEVAGELDPFRQEVRQLQKQSGLQ